jgi:hypothetical protein
MPRHYVRTCQACNYELKASVEPKDKSKASFLFRKCPRCKSEAFDYGSWRGWSREMLIPWREKFKALAGYDLVMTDNELETILSGDLGENGLFANNALFAELVKRSKANAESPASAIVSFQD